MNKNVKQAKPAKRREFDLSEHLPFRIAVISNLLAMDRDADLMALSGLRLREMRALIDIGSFGPIKASEISGLSRIDPFTISRATKSLVKEGLAKTIADPLDKRGPFFTLTPQGRELCDQIVEVLTARERRLESVLSKDETIVLLDLLRRIEHEAEEMLVEKAEKAVIDGEMIRGKQLDVVRAKRRRRAKSRSARFTS